MPNIVAILNEFGTKLEGMTILEEPRAELNSALLMVQVAT